MKKADQLRGKYDSFAKAITPRAQAPPLKSYATQKENLKVNSSQIKHTPSLSEFHMQTIRKEE